MAQNDREQAIAAITRTARESRARHSRTFWIAALAVGALGVAAFIVILIVDKGPSSSSSAPPHESGFATGLALGIAVGVAIGFAIARRAQSSRPHSDRSIP
ncbi:MAG: hypothetical protein M4D80_01410 [Myxococcota bacterium]|nr:hypothetical protein [Myxococcota bacterium]